MATTLIDCTLRDGGYYNNWDFSRELIGDYLSAMEAVAVDYVELGFRSLDKNGFRGACAFTTDAFIRSLPVPESLRIGVMVNASELLKFVDGPMAAAEKLFASAEESPVTLVRIACHLHEFEATLPVCSWLAARGYKVGINLMQVADLEMKIVESIGQLASGYPLDALYFADSLGGLDPERTALIVRALRKHWTGALGVHTHDNMGRAIANSLRALDEGATWVDSTVTGMGRGPGNAQTEYLVIELESRRDRRVRLAPLLGLIDRHFRGMQKHYGWGANPYYYLAGKYNIHPTYIQEMLNDPRYGEADILLMIEHLRAVGGKKFAFETLENGRQMYGGEATGTWAPSKVMRGREVLILGTGPGVAAHREAIELWIRANRPFVIALNTQQAVDAELIDLRAACHPLRLFADCESYRNLPQPVVVPIARLPDVVREALTPVRQHDFGLTVSPGKFEFFETSAVTPSSLVFAYALAMATSGQASKILLAGFDGFAADDPRAAEMEGLLATYQTVPGALPLLAVTPTRYRIPSTSVYAL